ncbi:uncharacterized protein DUF4350 [Actinomadura hallensis]|uniref:Uncharacterized protein DUF4350 n=1 Tax=Actinomadura hallensis TaxID=337895 RepID=A0A543I9X4_9ACTN|nr:DUF4350 domain-containing protein [Actinomadura hallensis]TQM67388.1 uncharacterized protein DUF4350 [Actinomadura hallensis]HLV72796.1 DUF4350 domain-containing protein [Vulgatibacteraceae bacterium]
MVTQTPPQGAPADTNTANGPGAQAGRGGQSSEPSARQVAGRRWRSARGVVAVILAMVVVAVILAALRPSTSPQALDPTSPKQDGSRALAEILRQNGTPVDVARNADEAVSKSGPGTVMVVTRTERLTGEDLTRLAGAQVDLVLVRPTSFALADLAPRIRKDGTTFEEADEPGCPLQAATLAGAVALHESETYRVTASVTGAVTTCYMTEHDRPRLVQVRHGTKTVTVLGSAAPLTNRRLTEEGNAALAMNLLGTNSNSPGSAGADTSVVWLVPDIPREGAGAGQQSLTDLLPFGVKLFLLQLLVAVVLVALWRSRRLGPVVAEALPVVVRSAETVEGRARLYRAGHARDRASDALRSGARERLVPLLGLPRSSAQDPSAAQEIVAAVARRTPYDETYVGAALYGPEPLDDAGLIALSDVLDDLERQVRQS